MIIQNPTSAFAGFPTTAGAALRVHQLIPNNYIFKFLKPQVLTIVKMGGVIIVLNYFVTLQCKSIS